MGEMILPRIASPREGTSETTTKEIEIWKIKKIVTTIVVAHEGMICVNTC